MNLGELIATLGIDTTELELAGAKFKKLETEANRSLKTVQQKIDSVGNSMMKFGKKASLYITTPIVAAGGLAVSNAIKFEKLATSLNVLTGSAEKGAAAFERIKKFSAATPFQLDELVQVNNTLMGFGQSTNQAYNSLRMLSDMAAVSGSDLNRLAIAFGQSAAMGRVMTMDLTQFVNNGVPVYKLLGDITGKTSGEIRKMAERGQISFDLLNRAFQKATTEGGLFYKGTETLSQTLGGVLSTLRDNFNLLMGSFGDLLGNYLKPFAKWLTTVMQNITELNDTTKLWILGIGGAAVIIGPLAVTFGALAKGIALATGAFKAFTAAKAIAFAEITALIALLGSLIFITEAFNDSWLNTALAYENATLKMRIAIAKAAAWIVEKVVWIINSNIQTINKFADKLGFKDLIKEIDITNILENNRKGIAATQDQIKKNDELRSSLTSFSDAVKKNWNSVTGIFKSKNQEIIDSNEELVDSINEINKAVTGSSKITISEPSRILDDTGLFEPESIQLAIVPITQLNNEFDNLIDKKSETISMLQELSSSFSQIGYSIQGAAGNWIEWTAGILSSLPKIIGMINVFKASTTAATAATAANTAATAANASMASAQAAADSGAAVAAATKQGAKMPFPLNLVAIASGVAAVLMAIASIPKAKSAAKMKEGGIVPGGYPNDSYPAMLTSGEMVIPPQKLPDLQANTISNGDWVIRGEDLYYIQNEMSRKHNNSF